MTRDNEHMESADADTSKDQEQPRTYTSYFYNPKIPNLLRPRAVPISPYGWYRVLVYSHNSGYTVNQVLDRLRLAVAPRRLRYYYLHRGGEQDVERDTRASFTFYVDNYKLAAELQLRGHCPPVVGLRVNDRPPNIRVDDALKWKLRQVIMSRYDATRSSLNLCRIHAHAFWRDEFFAMQQVECLEAIIDIMEQEMPQLRCLLLDKNHLCYLGSFRNVEHRLPRLKCISLQRNQLKSLRELRVFQRLRLTELTLHRNPLPRNYEQHVLFMFPHLRVLNLCLVRQNHIRQKDVISVSESESESDSDSDVQLVSISECKPPVLPEPRVTYLVPHELTPELRIRRFVRRYLKAFDGDDRRSSLRHFYWSHVLVSLTLSKERTRQDKWANPYLEYGTQFLANRHVALKMFASWPRTQHLSSTLTIDLTLVQSRILCLSITGSFQEGEVTTELVRHYMRSFILTRSNESDDFRIANELIYLGREGHGQRRFESTFNPSQRHLLNKLSMETRLKSRWSSRFLKDTNWDYQQALLAFHRQLRRHEIPAKAFEGGAEPTLSP